MQFTTAALDESEPLLVELARHGDKEAFGELVRRHHHRCVDLAVLFLRNRWDAEDEVQNAFSKAHAHLDQYQGDSEFSSWLSRIVTNQCLMLLRQKRRTRFVYLDDTRREDNGPPMEVPSCGPDPEGELAYGEMKRVLRTAIRRIPPLLRNVVILRDIEGLPMLDVAEALKISVPAAKSRLLRARTELRVRLRMCRESVGSTSPLSRSAAPFTRVAHSRALHPVVTTGV